MGSRGLLGSFSDETGSAMDQSWMNRDSENERMVQTSPVRNAKAKEEHWSESNAHLVSGGPSTQFLSEVSERIFRQGLGEDISSLFICVDVVNADATGVDVITEMVVLDRKVARTQFISFVVANWWALWLSLCTTMCGCRESMFHMSTIVSSRRIKGMTSRRAVDIATYSASQVDKATDV
jgi:hypothetical protein